MNRETRGIAECRDGGRDVGYRILDIARPGVLEADTEIMARQIPQGVEEIQQTLSTYSAKIAERAAPLGLSSEDASLRAGHYLGLRLPGGVPDGLLERLAEEQVYVSVRGTSIRVTPHR